MLDDEKYLSRIFVDKNGEIGHAKKRKNRVIAPELSNPKRAKKALQKSREDSTRVRDERLLLTDRIFPSSTVTSGALENLDVSFKMQ